MMPIELLTRPVAGRTDPEQQVLYLKALIGEATSRAVFLDCLGRLGAGPDGRAWSARTLNPILQRLQAKGLLDETLAYPTAHRDRLIAEALSSPAGQALLRAVRDVLPPDQPNRHWYDSKTVEADTDRWMRLAVHLNDVDEFNRLQELRARHCRTALGAIAKAFASAHVGAAWLSTRAPVFQAAILSAKTERLIATGLPVPDHDELVEQARRDCRADPALLPLWPLVADADLLHGRLASLAEHIAAPPPGLREDLVPTYAGAHALLSGDIPGAVARFAEALRLHRKVTRKRKGRLPDHLELLRLTALVGADDAALHAEIEDGLEGKERSPGFVAIRALLELARNRHGRANHEAGASLGAAWVINPPPLETALGGIAALLVGHERARRDVGQFARLFRLVEHTLPLVAGVVAETLERVSETPARYRALLAAPDREVRLRFTGLLKQKEPWERVLDSVEALLAPAGTPPTAEPAVKPRRLVWMVDPDGGGIQPLEQAVQARGGWSAGRAVALKRLQAGDPKLDYLDDHDRRAARTIRVVDGWNRYGQDEYEIQPALTLPALVGHPRVFDRRAPAVPVELVAGRPELVVSAGQTGFRLALSHAAVEPGAIIEVEAPGRWRVVIVDDNAVAVASMLGPGGIQVPAGARDRLAALARTAAPGLPVRLDATDLDDGSIDEGIAAPVVRLTPLGAGLKVSLVVRPFGADGPHFLPGVGSRMVNAQIAGRLVRVRRDLGREQAAAQALAGACPSLGGEGPDWTLDDLSSSLELLAELRALPEPVTLEWPEGRTLAVRGDLTATSLKASVNGAADWFTFGGSVTVDEDRVLDLQDLLERLSRAQGRFVPLDNGDFVALDRHFRAQLDRLKLLGETQGSGVKLSRAAAIAVRDLLDDAGSLKADPHWRAFARRLDEAAAWQPVLAPGFEAELRDYQMAGFAWLARLARWGAGACLADDMGLGKTVQAIAVMATLAPQGPCLVVAPTSVCGNWEAELARFAPGLNVHRLAEAGDRSDLLAALGPGDVVIASYGLLVRAEERLTAVSWAAAVLDEAQAIKNAETLRAKASLRLQAGFRLALSGTPVENDLDELWSLFRFVNPGLLGSRQAFQRRFATPIQQGQDAGARAALKALLRPFLLRRSKAAVLAELPPRTEQTLLVEMGAEERAFYEALRRRALDRLAEAGDGQTRMHILAEIMRLRQACCHPALVEAKAAVPAAKHAAVLELIDELRRNRHRALVFSQFVGHLDKLRGSLDAAGIPYQYLDGSTPAREREKRVAAFQAGEGALFLISLKAGGVGLNLTGADYVVHLDPWWNPAVEDQASDRAHRIGQTRPVTIYRLIVKDSIEEGIVALHRRKRDLADALLEGADAAARLSEADLLDLIRG